MVLESDLPVADSSPTCRAILLLSLDEARALLTARDSGDHFAMYDPAEAPHQPQHLSLMAELRTRLEAGGEFFPAYQPKIALRLGHATVVEALIRWIHPQHG